MIRAWSSTTCPTSRSPSWPAPTNMKITTRDDLPQAEQISLEIRKRLARERMHQVFAQVREQ